MNIQKTPVPNAAKNPELNLSEKTWFHVMMMIFFWPIGLYLIAKTKRYSKKVRFGVPITFVCLFIIGMFAPPAGSHTKSTPYDLGHFQMTGLLSKATRDPGPAGIFGFIQLCKMENKTVRSYNEEQVKEWESGIWAAYQEYAVNRALIGR